MSHLLHPSLFVAIAVPLVVGAVLIIVVMLQWGRRTDAAFDRIGRNMDGMKKLLEEAKEIARPTGERDAR
ncbi:hypothetical protein [Microvirga alba]|uniref:Uncharacterized protein n=1 Tax=Microvirga alba TaxID=2791025 RepID=A0A931BPM9_9HYPH|nr:hypothetical protein [Microvirga alba]MBF9234671.1 hypothetical protein [Microvirga alba]